MTAPDENRPDDAPRDLTGPLRLARLRGERPSLEDWRELLTGLAVAGPGSLDEPLENWLNQVRSGDLTFVAPALRDETLRQPDPWLITAAVAALALNLQGAAEACEHDPQARCEALGLLRGADFAALMTLDLEGLQLQLQLRERLPWNPFWVRIMLDHDPPGNTAGLARATSLTRNEPHHAGWVILHARRLRLTRARQ